MTWTHEHSWTLAAPVAAVYAALTDPAQLERWFAEHVDVHPVSGGAYRFWGRHSLATLTAADAHQVITRIEPGRALEFTWPLHGVPGSVAIALAAEEEATRLTLHHHVAGELPVPRQRDLIDDHWKLAFGNLAAHLAGGSGIVRPDFTDPAPEVRLVITIDAPPEAVFRALVEPDTIKRWFDSASPVVEPRVGGRYSLGWKYQVDGRDVQGGPTRILELVPNEKLVLDWPDWRGDESMKPTRIAFHLEPDGAATKVTFVHSGFERATDISDYPFGWGYFLGKLREVGSGVPSA